MRLKVLTSCFFVVVLALLVAYPSLLHGIPDRSAPITVRRAYAVRSLDYLALLVFALVGAGIGSFLVYRRARKEYEEESIRNLKSLLEAPTKHAEGADDRS